MPYFGYLFKFEKLFECVLEELVVGEIVSSMKETCLNSLSFSFVLGFFAIAEVSMNEFLK